MPEKVAGLKSKSKTECFRLEKQKGQAELEELDEEIRRLQAQVALSQLPKPAEGSQPGAGAMRGEPDAEPSGDARNAKPLSDAEQIRMMLDSLDPRGPRKPRMKVASPGRMKVVSPQDPPMSMSQMKASQIAPLLIMAALGLVDIKEMGYVRHTEAMFVISQLLCIGVRLWIFTRITAKPDTGEKVKIPEAEDSPATVQSPKEYDATKWTEGMKQAVMVGVITGGIYHKCGYLTVLVLQTFLMPLQLSESPLFQAHVLNKHVDRPFATQDFFGMPVTLQPPAEEVKDNKEVNDNEEEKKAK